MSELANPRKYTPERTQKELPTITLDVYDMLPVMDDRETKPSWK